MRLLDAFAHHPPQPTCEIESRSFNRTIRWRAKPLGRDARIRGTFAGKQRDFGVGGGKSTV